MKNKLLFLILTFLLVFPFCSSAQIEMKDSYKRGETLITKISGNFIQPPFSDGIHFYRRHMPTTMDFVLIKLNENYYVYATIPFEKIADNYSIVIEDVRYMQGSIIKEENLFHNFSIGTEIADFSISPAALVASSNFYLSVQNNLDSEISLTVSFSNETKSSGGFFSFFTKEESADNDFSFSLYSGEEKKINFDIEDFSEGLSSISFSSTNLDYEVPLQVFKEKENVTFYFEDSKINLSLRTDYSKSKRINLFNHGEKAIENVSLSLSSSLESYVALSKELIEKIEPNSSAEIKLTFFSKKEKYVEGSLKAEKGEIASSLPIYLEFDKEDEEDNNEEEDDDNDGYENDVDCDDNEPLIHPNAKEYCDDKDNDCDDEIDEDCKTYPDADKDGYPSDVDCNDNNSSIHSGAKEYCDKVDNDCNDKIDDNCINKTKDESSKTCSELGGAICGSKLVCSVPYISAKDDRCCVGGSCQKEKVTLNKEIIGWFLLIITILFFIYFLASKYLRTKNKINFSRQIGKK